MKRDLIISCAVAAVSLIVAAVCHFFFPGFGAMFKPLLWPLVLLPFTVRMREACATAVVVPLLSCAVNGMPTFPVALSLSAIAGIVCLGLGLIVACFRRSTDTTSEAIATVSPEAKPSLRSKSLEGCATLPTNNGF